MLALSALALAAPATVVAATPAVAAGPHHSIALKSDGTVVAWGDDSYGQLGLGRASQSSLPTRVSGLSDVKQIAATSGYSLAVKADGTAWAWGNNRRGELGDGSTTNRSIPQLIPNLQNVVAVAGTQGFAMALKTDGTIAVWGAEYGSVSMQGLAGVSAIAAGKDFALALNRDGTVWAAGRNYAGQLGDGTASADRSVPAKVLNLTDIVAIAASEQAYSLALKRDGTVWSWGYKPGSTGSVVDPANYRAVPEPVPGLSDVKAIATGMTDVSLVLKNDGTVWQSGYGVNAFAFVLVKGLDNVLAISAGENHWLAAKSDGTVWAWGSNNNGQLGTGPVEFCSPPSPGLSAYCTTLSSSVPVQVSKLSNVKSVVAAGGLTSYSFAIAVDGTVWSWGDDSYGQLGAAAITLRPVPADVSGLGGVVEIAAGDGAFGGDSFAIKNDGSVWAWGDNNYGALGDGTTTSRSTPTRLPGLTDVKSISPVVGSTFALKNDGTVWAWGATSSAGWGGAGIDGAPSSPTPWLVPGLNNVIALAVDRWHGLALKRDGTVWSWGGNYGGELGDGTTVERHTPAPVPGLSDVIAIAAGGSSYALRSDGTVWAWGANYFGQLGDGSTVNRPTPGKVPNLTGVVGIAAGGGSVFALKNDGTVMTWGSSSDDRMGLGNQYISSPVPVPAFANVIAIAVGEGHTLAIRRDGSVPSVGGNDLGQLGDGTLARRSFPGRVVNQTATGFLSLTGASLDNSVDPFTILQVIGKTGTDLTTTITDLRAAGFSGEIYFTALLPRSSPLVRLMKKGQRDAGVGMIPMTFGRSGYKQTGPGIAAESSFSGAIGSDSQYTIYEKAGTDPLAGSNAVICMGITAPGLSAKGQAVTRMIATGNQVSGVVQCPAIQTAMTSQMYTSQVSGAITARTLTAIINPLNEDRGKVRNLYSWAVALNGQQLMQTGPNQWRAMAEPMQAAMSLTVPATGPISLPVIDAYDLSPLLGTLVYVGMGSSWEEVRSLNMAGHYYTVQ